MRTSENNPYVKSVSSWRRLSRSSPKTSPSLSVLLRPTVPDFHVDHDGALRVHHSLALGACHVTSHPLRRLFGVGGLYTEDDLVVHGGVQARVARAVLPVLEEPSHGSLIASAPAPWTGLFFAAVCATTPELIHVGSLRRRPIGVEEISTSRSHSASTRLCHAASSGYRSKNALRYS